MKLNQKVMAIPQATSIFINQIVYDKKKTGERVYTYSLGEAFFDIPRFEITDEQFIQGYHYSGSLGQPKLREKIADLYKKYYSADVNPENEILISAGSKVIIYMLLLAVLNDGDEVMIPEPAWLSYKEQVVLANGVTVPVPYTKSVFEWDEYITENTKVIIINNPNNPSGQLYTEEELNHLLMLAKKHDLFILSDEAYSDFLYQNDKFFSFLNIDTEKKNSLIVNSLSKNMGMSGWRIGYAIACKEVIEQLLKLNQHLLTCAPTVLQDYLANNFEAILAHTVPQAQKIAEKRKQVQAIMDSLGIKALAGVGTFYFMLDVSAFRGTTDELVLDLLLNHNIALVPGSAYGESTKDFVRFGVGVENLEDITSSLKMVASYLAMSSYSNDNLKKQLAERGLSSAIA